MQHYGILLGLYFSFIWKTDDQITLITFMARKAGFGGGVVVDYPNSEKARKVFLCLMVGSGKYAFNASNLGDGMEVNEQGLPKGLDGEEDPPEQKSIVFERRRAREKSHDKKGKKKGVDMTWILKKRRCVCFFLPTLINESLMLVHSYIGRRERRMFRMIHDIQEDDANRSFDNLTVVLNSFGIHINVTTFNRRISSGLWPADLPLAKEVAVAQDSHQIASLKCVERTTGDSSLAPRHSTALVYFVHPCRKCARKGHEENFAIRALRKFLSPATFEAGTF
jgi:hypothetical protein